MAAVETKQAIEVMGLHVAESMLALPKLVSQLGNVKGKDGVRPRASDVVKLLEEGVAKLRDAVDTLLASGDTLAADEADQRIGWAVALNGRQLADLLVCGLPGKEVAKTLKASFGK